MRHKKIINYLQLTLYSMVKCWKIFPNTRISQGCLFSLLPVNTELIVGEQLPKENKLEASLLEREKKIYISLQMMGSYIKNFNKIHLKLLERLNKLNKIAHNKVSTKISCVSIYQQRTIFKNKINFICDGGDICTHIADSHFCTIETNILKQLCSNKRKKD